MDIQDFSGNRGRTRRTFSLSAFLLLAASALATLPAHAGGLPVCVSTNAELANALASAAFVPATIKIVQGNYDLRSTILHGGLFSVSLQDGSELLGGYTAGCAGRDIEVGNTVLDDTNPNRRDEEGADTLGDLTVEGLTWTVGVGFAAGADGHTLPRAHDAPVSPRCVRQRQRTPGPFVVERR